MLWTTTGIITSYLFGSIPTAYIFGRLLKGIDIRRFGSGNVGATNAFRVLGRGTGVVVLLLDILKGFITVSLLGNLIYSHSQVLAEEPLRILLGVSCVCGHNWTLFLNFKGGKGIAATFGVLIGLSLKISGLKYILILTILTWIIVFVVSRIISISSVAAAIALPVFVISFRESGTLKLLSIVLCCLVILRHWPNLKRFSQGKEPRLNLRKS